jgi:hypothetical protein
MKLLLPAVTQTSGDAYAVLEVTRDLITKVNRRTRTVDFLTAADEDFLTVEYDDESNIIWLNDLNDEEKMEQLDDMAARGEGPLAILLPDDYDVSQENGKAIIHFSTMTISKFGISYAADAGFTDRGYKLACVLPGDWLETTYEAWEDKNGNKIPG